MPVFLNVLSGKHSIDPAIQVRDDVFLDGPVAATCISLSAFGAYGGTADLIFRLARSFGIRLQAIQPLVVRAFVYVREQGCAQVALTGIRKHRKKDRTVFRRVGNL
jgi:hypothetical protein